MEDDDWCFLVEADALTDILVCMGHGKNEVWNGSRAWVHKAEAALANCDLTDALQVEGELFFKEEGFV